MGACDSGDGSRIYGNRADKWREPGGLYGHADGPVFCRARLVLSGAEMDRRRKGVRLASFVMGIAARMRRAAGRSDGKGMAVRLYRDACIRSRKRMVWYPKKQSSSDTFDSGCAGMLLYGKIVFAGRDISDRAVKGNVRYDDRERNPWGYELSVAGGAAGVGTA